MIWNMLKKSKKDGANMPGETCPICGRILKRYMNTLYCENKECKFRILIKKEDGEA